MYITADIDGRLAGTRTHRAKFDFTFDKLTGLVRHMEAKLFIFAPATTDMDVSVAEWKLDTKDNSVEFAYYAQHEDTHVALGWLRAS